MVGIDTVTRQLIGVPQSSEETGELFDRLRSLINQDRVDRPKSRRAKRKGAKNRWPRRDGSACARCA